MEEKISELEKQLAELKAELKEKKEKQGKWIPEDYESYYYLDSTLSVNYHIYTGDWVDENIIKYNKVFKTQEQAQRYANYLKAKHEYSYEFSIEEWKDFRINKFYIYYFFEHERLYVQNDNYSRYLNKTYFKTEEKAKEFIDKYKKEILEFEFGIVGE